MGKCDSNDPNTKQNFSTVQRLKAKKFFLCLLFDGISTTLQYEVCVMRSLQNSYSFS